MLDNEKNNNSFDDSIDRDNQTGEDIFAEEDLDLSDWEEQIREEAIREEPPTGFTGQKEDHMYSYRRIDHEEPKVNRYREESEREPHRPEPKKKSFSYGKAIGCALLCGVIVGGCIIGSFAIGKQIQGPSAPIANVETNENKLSSSKTEAAVQPAGSGYTVAEIAKNCSSSVVAITNKGISEVQTFFGVYQQETEGSGSGVIISQTDTELLVATNYHVIEGSEQLTVCFNDSEDAVYSAQIKGTDPDNDLAVVALQLKEIDEEVLDSISIATLGDSEKLQIGDQIVAIGNALGRGQSVTTGIVSALNRDVEMGENTTASLIQTDAAINPGNSGGAMFNMNGELVGINSAKYASEAVEGMGFAIPMSTAETILEDLMTKETRSKLTKDYGCLNITGADVDRNAVKMYGIPLGVYVDTVVEGAAADRAGIQSGDIITSLAGTKVESMTELKEELQYHKAGETVEIIIQRNENNNGYVEKKLTITLDNASEQQAANDASNGNGQNNSGTQRNEQQPSMDDFSQFFGNFFR